MSPLPEINPNLEYYMTESEEMNLFLERGISPEDHLSCRVKLGDKHKERELYKEAGVNFDIFLEEYSTDRAGGGLVFHKIFSSHEKGLYLELLFDELPDLGNVSKMLDLSKRAVFHRLGKNLNQEYIDSLLSGEFPL